MKINQIKNLLFLIIPSVLTWIFFDINSDSFSHKVIIYMTLQAILTLLIYGIIARKLLLKMLFLSLSHLPQ